MVFVGKDVGDDGFFGQTMVYVREMICRVLFVCR